jgi:hypothetical protein
VDCTLLVEEVGRDTGILRKLAFWGIFEEFGNGIFVSNFEGL